MLLDNFQMLEAQVNEIRKQLDLISSWIVVKFGNEDTFPEALKTIIGLTESINSKSISISVGEIILKNELCETPEPTSAFNCTESSDSTSTTNILIETTKIEPEDSEVNLIDENPKTNPVTKPCFVKLIKLSADSIFVSGSIRNRKGKVLKKCGRKPKPRPPGQPICKICGKNFQNFRNLDYHSQIHTGEKPYKCKVCGKLFSSGPGYKYHIRTHTGDTPYVCSVCNKGFKSRPHLTSHLRVHTGEKPFQCEYCGKNFSEYPNYKKHRKLLQNDIVTVDVNFN